jgi:hypothetical protein
MKKTFYAILVLAIVGISCKKTDSAPVVVKNYMSLTAGNTWTYEITNNITSASSTNIVSSSNRDSTISGKIFHVFTNSNGAVNDYYNITAGSLGNDYYTFKNFSAALPNTTIQTIYLKDYAALGASWSQTENVALFSGVPTTVPVTITNTVAAKGISRTVNSKVYTDVIHITTSMATTGLPLGALITDIQTYYAPKYGLIESKNKIVVTTLGINTDQTTVLKTASF